VGDLKLAVVATAARDTSYHGRHDGHLGTARDFVPSADLVLQAPCLLRAPRSVQHGLLVRGFW
jgi:hypothetical protein